MEDYTIKYRALLSENSMHLWAAIVEDEKYFIKHRN